MEKRRLRNIEVSPIGIGCMGFCHGYGEIPTEESALKRSAKHMNSAVHSLIRQKLMDRTCFRKTKAITKRLSEKQ